MKCSAELQTPQTIAWDIRLQTNKGVVILVIGILGESCVGKTTLATALQKEIGGKIVTGKDYLRLAKSESEATALFQRKLQEALSGNHILYVISEKAHLALLPEGAIRILVTADLDTILKRFASRMHGNLPAPVKAMLERKHGCFDGEMHHIHVTDSKGQVEKVCRQIRALL